VIFGVDYSAGVPAVAALQAAGVQFVARYVSPGDRRKDLTRAEADTVRGAGIQVVTVYEDTVGDARGGRLAGVANARFVNAELPRLGAPPGAPCYFAVDFDAQGAEVQTAIAYVQGAASILGLERTGVYGGYWVVKACLDAGACTYAWQTVAWSDGWWDPRAQLRQRNGQLMVGGIECDRDYALTADYGQWNPEEADMPLTEAEWERLGKLVDAKVKAHTDRIYGLIYRGDAGEPDAHPANLEQIRKELGEDTADVLTAVRAGATLSDAQVELLAGLVAAKLEVAGHPAYEGEALISIRPKEATP
jgi:hypothetical protein